MRRGAIFGLACIVALAAAEQVQAGILYSNDFESASYGVTDWSATARVSSGTNGIASAGGGFHAESQPSAFTRWGGYNFGAGTNVPTQFQEFSTKVDIYLDVDGGWANNTRFDYDSAISNSGGGFQRDFIFNGGFFNDATGPGAGGNRFVFSASNNSQPGNAFAKNPGRNPIAISDSGWYTFEHHFRDNAGVLAVDMSIFAGNSLVYSWTLSNASDLIGQIGGNRYGWFDFSEFPTLAIDNAQLSTAVPEPASLAIWGLTGLALAIGAARRRRTA